MSASEVAQEHLRGLAQSFSMIIASEIGDKTFLIAAILAMRHPRAIVFAGAFGSLVVMSILSAAMGHILPSLIPKKWTQFAAAVLFLVFGLKMGFEAREMKGGNDKIQEEMREVEMEIEGEEGRRDGTAAEGIPLEEMERGEGHTAGPPPESSSGSALQSFVEGARNFFGLILGPIFVQAFVLTFLGEWGDRSQIATIALAAAHNVYIVTVGTIVGHACCTALAVIGGRWLSTKISVKHVTLGGAFLFLLFAVIYFHESWTFSESPLPHEELGATDKDWIPQKP